jgi:hypothetical protein
MGCTPALLLVFYLLVSYRLGWSLQGFSHVLNVTREPLLGLLQSHTLYHAPTNRSDVTWGHLLLG